MALLKAFSSGVPKVIQKALEALIDLPGELGQVIKALVKHSVDWVQNMIEVARETDVLKRATRTVMKIVMMMTPNLWAEGIGMVEGYLLPEVLITIALLFIGALCNAAGASVLAVRIAGVLSKLRKAIGAAGKVGKVLTTLFGKLDEIAKLIGDLSKTLRRKINETVEGVTDRLNPLKRSSSKKKVQAKPLDPLGLKHKKKAEQIDQLEGGHSLARHGPEVSDALLKQRLKTGLAPDGKYSPAPASTRFSSYDEWIKTREDALSAFQKREGIDFSKLPSPGGSKGSYPPIDLDHGRPIGEGFVGSGTKSKINNPITGKKMPIFSDADPVSGLTSTTTTVDWDSALNKWVVKQHFPKGTK